jgi:hypothetical protein
MRVILALWVYAGIAVAVLLTGCGVSASVYRIDERQASETQKALPLKCWFTNCGGEEK